jgi:uncharacterized Ntn-hydrolase superfamily protein
MTFSVAARCPRTLQFGAGAVTGSIGVGKIVTHAKALVGAVATQAWVNPYLGFDGLRLLETGLTAAQVLDRLIQADPDRAVRQLGIVDRQGRTAAYTGGETLGWSGHFTYEGFTAQGNRLAGPQVLHAAAKAFRENLDRDLSERLLLALEAGHAVGGDKKGDRSATIFVMEREEYPLWDLRVDHHEDAMPELRRLYHQFEREFIPFLRKLPTREDPHGLLTHDQSDSFA